MKKNDDNIKKIANSAILMLGSRISGLLLVGICTWILGSVSGMKTDIATLIAKIDGINTRVANMEEWRNFMDANASETPSTKNH